MTQEVFGKYRSDLDTSRWIYKDADFVFRTQVLSFRLSRTFVSLAAECCYFWTSCSEGPATFHFNPVLFA